MAKKTETQKAPAKKKIESEIKDLVSMMPENEVTIYEPIFRSYEQQLSFYREQREAIDNYIAGNLKEGVDYGYTIGKKDGQTRKKTLMKRGAEKIAAYMNCRVKFYHDHSTYQMLGNKDSICFVAYLIDEKLLKLIMMAIMKVGIEHEERILKLFSWGEGRGCYEVDELVYSSKYEKEKVGKPLRGTYNRAVKMAEKRAETDLIIRVFGLEFTQDYDLHTNDLKEIYSRAMGILNNMEADIAVKKEYKYRIDNAANIEDIEKIMDEMSQGNNTSIKKDDLKLTGKNGVELLNKIMEIVNKDSDTDRKLKKMNEVIANKGNEEGLRKLLKKYQGGN